MGCVMTYSIYPTALFIAATLASSSVYSAVPPTSTSGYVVELHCGKSIALTGASALVLYEKAVQLVMSAEYNSKDAQWKFPQSEVQQEYLETLESDYVRVSTEKPLRIETRGGDVSALQIVIRLSPDSYGRSRYADHFTDALFTLDGNRKAAGYALYSGVAEYSLFATIADIPSNACRIPPRSELQRILGTARP
jgi:hypothetical protein